MPFYLSEYIGSGTKADPYTPVGSDQPGWGAIDLRPPDLSLNACLLWVPSAFNDARARFLADDKLESLSQAQRNFITNRLNVDLQSDTLLQDIIAAIMTRPPASGWNPLQAVRRRMRYEIWMAGQLIWEKPAQFGPQGELIDPSDNFDRVNETPVASPWTKLGGVTNTNLTSNRLLSAADGEKVYYYSGAASSADQYAQCDTADTVNSDAGPAVRVGSNGFSCYLITLYSGTQLWSLSAGSYSHILDFASAASAGDDIRMDIEGSTISFFKNGVEDGNSPTTNTVLTTAGNGVGFFMYSGELDNWAGGDLTPPVEMQTLYHRRSIRVQR